MNTLPHFVEDRFDIGPLFIMIFSMFEFSLRSKNTLLGR